MRVLITGGTGFIGARLAVMARDAGHEVRLTGLVNRRKRSASVPSRAGIFDALADGRIFYHTS